MKKLIAFVLGILFAGNLYAANLPSGYTELEYIQSDGNQYITTDIVADTLNGMEIEFTILNDMSAGTSLFGARAAGNVGQGVNVGHSVDKKVTVDWFDGTRYTSSVLFEKNLPYRLVIQNSIYTLYNKTTGAVLDTHTFNINTKDDKYTLALFGLNNGGTGVNSRDSVRMTKVQLYVNSNNVSHNLVPAKYGSTVGLYDVINNRFYTDANGGNFTGGDPVNTCPNGQVLHTYTSATGTVTQTPAPTPSAPVTPTFYQQGNIVLRKVGDVADSYDASTGIITRRVGYFVTDGSTFGYRENLSGEGFDIFFGEVSGASNRAVDAEILSDYFLGKQNQNTTFTIDNSIAGHNKSGNETLFYIRIPTSTFNKDADEFRAFFAAHPFTVYYPLKEPTTEYVGTQWCEGIKIATTKYNTNAFSSVVTALNNAVDTIKTVVANTINQATAVANLQSGKQTMPDSTTTNGTCPNYKQCLLVEDESGTSHWYVITDPFRDFVAPIIATNAAATSNTSQVASSLPTGYTELSYIETTGGQWINTGLKQLFGADAFTITTTVATTVNNRYGSLLGNKGDASTAAGLGLYINTQYNNVVLFSHHAPEKQLGVSSVNFYNGQFHTLTAYYDGNGTGGYVIDGTTFQATGVNTASVDNSNNYYILKNAGGLYFVGKVKTINIVAGGVERFNFVPAKRNSDGVIGMYDTVGNVFYTNSGGGTFRGGDELPMQHTWTVRWNNNGDGVGVTVNGIAKCNNSSSDATNTASGGACWCKATDLIVNSESIANDSASWAFYRSYSGTECDSACANACGYTVRNNATFRRTVFGQ